MQDTASSGSEKHREKGTAGRSTGQPEMISANTKRLLAFHVQLGKFHQTDLSQERKRRKVEIRGGGGVQPGVRTGARQLEKKKKTFQGICLAVTRCHESKTNREAKSDHKCVSPLAAIVVRALDSEDSAERGGLARNRRRAPLCGCRTQRGSVPTVRCSVGSRHSEMTFKG